MNGRIIEFRVGKMSGVKTFLLFYFLTILLYIRAVIVRVLSCRDIAALPATISRYRRRDIEVESCDYLKFCIPLVKLVN